MGRRRSQTTASSLPLSPAADRELRLSLRTVFPRGQWGLGWMGDVEQSTQKNRVAFLLGYQTHAHSRDTNQVEA